MIKKLWHLLLSERKRNDVWFFWSKVKAVFYKGNRYYCNCCERSFSSFLPYGNVQRKNAKCPNCLSLERTRLLWLYLTNELDINEKTLKVLHFAPERTLESKFKKLKNIQYISADINPELADVRMDLMDIPLQDNSIDLIICSHVLGHVPDETKAISEIARILKFNGKAIIITVIDPHLETTYEDSSITTAENRLRSYGERDLLRKHGKDFKNRIAHPSWTVSNIDYLSQLDASTKKRLSLGNGNRETLFVCVKS